MTIQSARGEQFGQLRGRVHLVHRLARLQRAAAHADHLEAESARVAGEDRSDRADADQEQRLAAQIVGQGIAAQRVPLVLELAPDVSAEAARQHEQPGQPRLRHRFGVRSGGAGDDHALRVEIEHELLLPDAGAREVNPLQIRRGQHHFPVGGIERLLEADVAVQEDAIDALAVGLRQPRARRPGQRHERSGFAGALGDGLELIAKAGNELFGNQCGGHGRKGKRKRKKENVKRHTSPVGKVIQRTIPHPFSGEGVVGRILVPDMLHVACRHYGHVVAMEARDEGEGHVSARGDPGRRQNIAVVHPARAPLPSHARSLLDYPVPRDLVGRGRPAIEQSGAGQ